MTKTPTYDNAKSEIMGLQSKEQKLACTTYNYFVHSIENWSLCANVLASYDYQKMLSRQNTIMST